MVSSALNPVDEIGHRSGFVKAPDPEEEDLEVAALS
jgi:hypothetical protein